MRRASPTLTPHELEIMKVVWSRGHATVRDVYEALLEDRKIAYTTVMTMMNVLEKKGHLRKKAEGRSFLYRPTRPQRQVVGSMVRDFVQRVFGGSAAPLLAHLVEEERLTPEDLDALARRIKEKR
jgi:predicted transcriptional regulator